MKVGNLRALSVALVLLVASAGACSGDGSPPPSNPPPGSSPEVEVEPARLDFGSVVVDQTLTRSLQVVNRGEEEVCIDADVAAGEAPEHFRVPRAAGGPFFVEPGGSTTLEVTFAPMTTGRLLAILRLDVCEGCTPVQVDLQGMGLPSSLVVQPTSIDFGEVGAPYCGSETVTFENVGNALVTVRRLELAALAEGQEPDGAFRLDTEAPFTLEPGGSQEVGVTFCPEDARLHLGKLHWMASDPRNLEGDVILRGQGDGPAIVLVPEALDFGEVAVGVPRTRRAVVTNVGYQDLVISGYEIRGSEAFTIESAPASNVLGVGEIGEILVTFAPTAESDETAQLVVTSDDAHTPQVVSELRGTGLDLGECIYEVQPPQLDFGIVDRNRKKTLDFVIAVSPVSPGACLVSALELTEDTDPAFTLPESTAGSVILQPGETHRVPVEFLPPRYAPRYRGAVRFYLSDPDRSEHVIPLTGSSREAEVLVAPSDLDFGVVKVGCSTPVDKQVCIYNTGYTTLHLTDLELVESGPGGEFLFQAVPPGLAETPPSEPIARGASACFTMAYEPQNLGDDTAAVNVTLAEFDEPFVINLSGTGVGQPVQTDTFVQLDRPKADVLFVVSNAPSMTDEQQSLAGNFDDFIAFATRQEIDYHLGVVSTDPTDQGILAPVDCSRERVVTPELADPAGLFRQNVQLATGSGPEQGLRSAYLALSEPNVSDPARNAGFLRPGTYLSVVFVSDGEDESPYPVDFYLNLFWNINGVRRKDLFSASAIVGGDPACSTACGQAAGAGQRYAEIQQHTGGIRESICTCGWAQALRDLGMIAFGYKTTFFLKNVPAQPWHDTITVVVHRTDGTTYTAEPRLTEGGPGEWWYEAESTAIRFSQLSRPEPGDSIVVTYSVQCGTG